MSYNARYNLHVRYADKWLQKAVTPFSAGNVSQGYAPMVVRIEAATDFGAIGKAEELVRAMKEREYYIRSATLYRIKEVPYTGKLIEEGTVWKMPTDFDDPPTNPVLFDTPTESTSVIGRIE